MNYNSYHVIIIISSLMGSLCHLTSELDNNLQITDVQMTVQGQYLDYPYPPFLQEDKLREIVYYVQETVCEKGSCPQVSIKRVLPKNYMPSVSPNVVNHSLFQGKQSFGSRFRILIAGGGTGGVVTFLGELLNHTESEIVYLDFSL